MRTRLLVAALALSACADEAHDLHDDHEHTDDVALGQNAGETMQGLAVAGRWTLPDDVAAIGEQQELQFDGAPPYDGGANCAPGPTAGALTFRDHLLGYFPQIASVGIYNCRVIAGTNSMSLHGVGRALDIMIPTVGGDADNELGDPIAHWLIENAEHIGVQTIIWDSSIWRVSRTPRFGAYTGSNPHKDHLHVELNIEASQEGTPWFADPTGPVACPALPVAETIVDEGHACFELFGPAQYWRTEAAGHGGSLRWTNAFSSDTPSNWARWSLPVGAPGSYRVEVYVDPTWGVFPATRYDVRAAGVVHPVVVDQSAADGWYDLGTYAFAGTGDEHVRVRDDAPGVVADEQHVVADALRLTPVGVPTCDPLPPTGGVVEEDGPCFALHGPAQYWRVEAAGSGGALLWTNAYQGDQPSNWAEWRLPVQQSGTYDVAVYLDPAHAQYAATKYALVVGGATTALVVDQSAADGWHALGAFALVADGENVLQVFDHADAAVPDDAKRIAVDAVRVAAPGAPPPDDEPPTEPPPTEPPPGDPPPPPDDTAPVDDDDPGAVGAANADDVERVVVPTPAASCAAVDAATSTAVALVALAGARRRRRR